MLLHALLALALLQDTQEPDDSLQARVDAAAPGATLQLPAGRFDERLVIDKPITLIGAGWDATRIAPTRIDFRDPRRPTLEVQSGGELRLVGVRLDGPPRSFISAGATRTDSIVIVTGGTARLEGCAVIGPASCGIKAAEGATLEIQGSLVAAIWGAGIAFDGSDAGASLDLRESVVRSCSHRCISVSGDAESVAIVNNWISGSAGHGIHYSGAPSIRSNVIYGNANSGLYASSATAGTVQGNLFWRNETDGISCWYRAEDRIEDNLFIDNRREHISVMGASQPTIVRNAFTGQVPVIRRSTIRGTGEFTEPTGELHLEENRFFGLAATVVSAGQVVQLADPRQMQPDEAPRTGRIHGTKINLTSAACASLVAQSPFSDFLPEELTMIPAGETRDSLAWQRDELPYHKRLAEGYRLAYDLRMGEAQRAAQPWILDAIQLEDAAVRQAALTEIRTAIASESARTVRAGLLAFNALREVRFDKTLQRDRFRELLSAEDLVQRALAAAALVGAGAEAADIERLIALTEDPISQVRNAAAQQLPWATNKDLTGPAGDAIATLIQDPSSNPPIEILRALAGSRFSAALEAAVITLSLYPEHVHDANDFALSTQANKSRASVERLIELLSHPDTTSVAGRAAWGLTQGVAPAEKSLVAAAALEVVNARDSGYLLERCLDLLERYAAADQVAGLQQLLETPSLSVELRARLEALIAVADGR